MSTTDAAGFGADAQESAQRSPIVSFALANPGAAASPAGAVTQIIGCPFKKGDLPNGEWPRFLVGTMPVRATILDALATRWSDGSLKFVPVMLSVPQSIAAGQTIGVAVYPGRHLPAYSRRGPADIPAGLRVEVDGLDNLSGTWAANLSAGTVVKSVTYGNGPGGWVGKVRVNFAQNGADHGQFVCDFYLAALANPDGSLKGLRVLGKLKLPYCDVTAGGGATDRQNFVSFSRMQVLCGTGTLVRDCFGSDAAGWNFGPSRAFAFAWQAGNVFAAQSGYSTKNGGDCGYLVRLATTGTLPAPLKTGTPYFTASVTASTIGFSTNSKGAATGLAKVSATDAGSGTHSATPYPCLAYFGALFTAGPNGMWDFVQGRGSDSADTSLRAQIDPKYWVATGLLPSIDTAIADVVSQPAAVYRPNSAEPLTRDLEETGDRPDIGPLTNWAVTHFLTQAQSDEQCVRVTALALAQLSIGIENSATLTLPCVNNGSDGAGTGYAGMPAPNPLFTWSPGAVPSIGFTDKTNPNVLIAGFQEQVFSHMPQPFYYAYLFTGEPQHLDALLENAVNAICGRMSAIGACAITADAFSFGTNACRNYTVGANPTRYGVCAGEQSIRTNAWGFATLVTAAAICPDIHPACASYKAYFCDMVGDNVAFYNDLLGALETANPYAFANGLGFVSPSALPVTEDWNLGYIGYAWCLAVSAAERSDALAPLNHLISHFGHVYETWGGWHLGAYQSIVKASNAQGAPLIASDAGYAHDGYGLSWSAGASGQFTGAQKTNGVLSDGDAWFFIDTIPSDPQACPAGFAKYTPYYAVNLSGNVFGLADSPGGAALPTTDANANADAFCMGIANPSTGYVAANSNAGYGTLVLGMLNNAAAVGASVAPGLQADMTARFNAAALSFGSYPKWGMAASLDQ